MKFPSLLAAALCAATTTAQADTTLTYGSALPAPHVVHEKGLAPFFDRVAAATNGELQMELIPGGAMGGLKEVVQMLQDNVTDMGLLLDIYQRQELPITSMFSDMITLPDDFIVFAAAANEMQLVACTECQAERKEAGLLSLAYYGPDPYRLMCSDGTKTFEDMANKKTQASGRLGVLMKELGATPVTLTSSETYESLQRGQADCAVASTAWLDSYSLKDVVKTVIDLQLGSYFNAGLLVMNRGVWDDLPEDQQQAIQSNLAELVVDSLLAYQAQGDAALDAAREAGVEIVEPDEKLKSILADFRKGEIENTIATAEANGDDAVRARVETYLALVEKWRGIVAEVGSDRAAFIEAMDREVFSKMAF